MNNKQKYGLIESTPSVLHLCLHRGFLVYTLSSEGLWDAKLDMENDKILFLSVRRTQMLLDITCVFFRRL